MLAALRFSYQTDFIKDKQGASPHFLLMTTDLKTESLEMKARLLMAKGIRMCSYADLRYTLKDPHKAAALRLLSVEKIPELCYLLAADKRALEHFIAEPDYHAFEIPKKQKGVRVIQAPSRDLKRLQRRLNYFLQGYYSLIAPYNVMGFVINVEGKHPRNIRINAAIHAGRHEVLNIDLKDFFVGISARQIMDLFTGPLFQYPKHIAATLTLLCTYQKSLPMGAPSSAILSNFICTELDAALRQLAVGNGLRYSRYADDISFSSTSRIDDDVVLDIINQIQACGFQVNFRKFRRQFPHHRQVVTGLTVNRRPNPDRQLLKNLRAMIHDFEQHGDEAAARHFGLNKQAGRKQVQKFLQKLKGQLLFVASIKGRDSFWVDKYWNKFQSALQKHSLVV
jgi:RNA-directed DNA polymerase